MRVAFYAPMKPPTSPRPSGDRRIGALFMAALKQAGMDVQLASLFRSWEGAGDPKRQQQLRQDGERIAEQLIQEYRDGAWQPDAWFTYHLYHKAPDWIGPKVASALNIPYFIAECSIANKQKDGLWSEGFNASLAAANLASVIFCINEKDRQGIENAGIDRRRIHSIAPFLDAPVSNTVSRYETRKELAARMKLDPDCYWLLTVAMMRNDVKLDSYQKLAWTMEKLERKDWSLFVIGDGPAELMVREMFRFDMDRKVFFLGKRDQQFVQQMMSSSDLFIWPALNEAIGMVALESLSCGLPVVWGNSGGIQQVVDHGDTGILIDHPEQNVSPALFAESIESLLANPAKLAAMSQQCLRKYAQNHHLFQAADKIRNAMLSVRN